MQQSLQNFACSGQHRVSVPLSIKMEFVVYQLALQAVNLPERVQTPSNSPSYFQWAARLVSKSAGLHPAVRGAKPRRSTIYNSLRSPI